MNEQQAYWLFCELKKLVKSVQGRPLDQETTGAVFERISYILDVSRGDRTKNEKLDHDITECTRLFILMVNSAEKLKSTL